MRHRRPHLPSSPWLAAVILALSACGSAAPGASPPDDEPVPTGALYRVAVEQCGGADNRRATGVAVGPDLVATVAHSLVDAKSVSLRAADGSITTAELVYLDPAKDVALLRVPHAGTSSLGLARPEVGREATVATYADEDGPTTKPAVIAEVVVATLDGEGRRAAVRLDADIEPGDSGAAVVVDGDVVGMVFATARGDDVGWAVNASELEAAIDEMDRHQPEALPPACPPESSSN